MEQFKNDVKQELENRGYEVRFTQVTKNNGLKLDGINLMTGEDVVPTIYLNEFYRDYQAGRVTIDDVCAEIIHISRQPKLDAGFDVKAFLMDWEQAKDRITYRLVGIEKNQELLKNRPHRIYLDMAVTYHVQITDEASVAVTNELMNRYGISVEELDQIAKKNTPSINPVEIHSMQSLLLEMAKEYDDEMMLAALEMEPQEEFYVISNRSKINGATTILYEDVLKDFAKTCGGDFALLPSSVHECILYPLHGKEMNAEEFKNMVTDINATQVPVDEVLTNSAYIYDSKANVLRIA